jgi:hypothetical protein
MYSLYSAYLLLRNRESKKQHEPISIFWNGELAI